MTPAPLRAPLALDGLQGQPGPDLVATDVQVLGTLESGQTLTVRWLDRNAGNLDAGVSWRDRVIVRNTTTNEVIANVLLPVTIGGAQAPLAPGQSLQREVAVALPEGARGAGNLSVTVTIDVDNAVAEQNATQTAESNNETAVSVTSVLATYADLVVGGLQVNPPTAWAAGASVTLSWRVDNSGTRAVDAPFVDSIQVRNLTTGAVVYSSSLAYDPATPGNGPIAAGDGRDRQLTFNWPASGAQGLFEFQVITDGGGTVFEVQRQRAPARPTTRPRSPSLPRRTWSSRTCVSIRAPVESGALLVLRWDDVNLGYDARGGQLARPHRGGQHAHRRDAAGRRPAARFDSWRRRRARCRASATPVHSRSACPTAPVPPACCASRSPPTYGRPMAAPSSKRTRRVTPRSTTRPSLEVTATERLYPDLRAFDVECAGERARRRHDHGERGRWPTTDPWMPSATGSTASCCRGRHLRQRRRSGARHASLAPAVSRPSPSTTRRCP